MTRGFAGGLAEGLNQGMQMYALSESIDSRRKQDERAAAADARDQESHEMKKAEVANNQKWTETMAGIMGWSPEMAAGSPVRTDAPSFGAPQQQETPSASVKLAGPMPAGGLSMNAPAAPYQANNPAGALQPQQPQQPQQQQRPVSADEFVQRQVLQGNAFGNPQVLNKMAAASFQLGQGDRGLAFAKMAKDAHDKGLPEAMSMLLQGDTKGATEMLRGRGLNLENELTPVEGKAHTYKATIDGKEREFSVREMAMMANPLEFYKHLDEATERARKADLEKKEYDLKVRKQDMDEKESTAKIGTERSRQAVNYARAKGTGTGDGASSKAMKAIETDRGRQFDLASMVQDEATGKKAVDPQRRQALDRAAYAQQGIVEDAFERKMSAAEHREFTDAMLDYPLDAVQKGDKAAVQKWQGEFMSRMGIDPAEEEAGNEQVAAGSLGNQGKKKKEETPPPEALKAEPTQEEREIKAVQSDAQAVPEMKALQRERTASNLSDAERAENTRKIDALLAKHGPKGGSLGYGKRPDGTEKGSGFLGVQKTKSGKDMTEYSVGLKINGKQRDVPTLVPGLSKKEIEYLKTEPDLRKHTPMNDSIIKKAQDHAKKRLSEGKSVFADEDKG